MPNDTSRVNPAGRQPTIASAAIPRDDDNGTKPSVSSSITASPATATATVKSALGLQDILGLVTKLADVAVISSLKEEIPFTDYVRMVFDNPDLIRTSEQRILDMILSGGRKTVEVDNETYYDYAFFRNTVNPADKISGMTSTLHNLVEAIGGAAKATGPNKRVILLAGPVGTSKTTIVRALTTGLEKYSRTEEGKLYSLTWDLTGLENDPAFKHIDTHVASQIFEDPFNLIPLEDRREIVDALNQRRAEQTTSDGKSLKYSIRSEKELSPACRDIYDKLLKHYDGDRTKVLQHAKVRRLLLDEKTRTGITFFGAKDEKSHNAAELSGSVNVRKLMQIGVDSDPQALSLDGDVLRANRGIAHFGELLKMPKEITYPLLDASQDRNLKVDKGSLVDFDTLIIATTNMPDWRRVLRDEFQEAIRSRIFPVTVPYLDKIDDEMGIYAKEFSKACTDLGIHEAPHGRWVAALWALTTRLAEPKEGVDIVQKALLYSGKRIRGFTENDVIQMKRDVPDSEQELLRGISPRDVQDALAAALEHPDVIDDDHGSHCVDPYIIIDELEQRLQQPVANVTADDKKKFLARLKKAEKELDRQLLNDVRRAVSGDEKETKTLFNRYMMHVRAFNKNEKVKDHVISNREIEPDEDLMQGIEQKMGIGESRRKEYRRYLIEQIGDKAIDGEEFKWDTDEQLKTALEEYLVEKHKDAALPVFSEETANADEQAKIDVVKGRLKDSGYCDHCSVIALRRSQAPENRGSGK